MKKLIDLQAYCKRVSSFLCDILQRLSSPEAMSTSTVREEFCFVIIKLVDVLQRLDNLKDAKACLLNDFSLYKRSFAMIRSELPAADVLSEEMQQLQMFLAHPGYPNHVITSTLNESIKQIDNHQDVLLEAIKLCCTKIERRQFVTPCEKYCLHRALPYLVFFIDTEMAKNSRGKKGSSFNAFRARKMPIARIREIIKALPVVPELADVTVFLPSVLAMCPNYNDDKISESEDGVKNCTLTAKWSEIRSDYTRFVSRFCEVASDVSLRRVLDEALESDEVTSAEIVESTRQFYDLVREGVSYVSSWTCRILEMSAWKFQHPADEATMKQRGWEPNQSSTSSDSETHEIFFEKVVRYNYSDEELSVLVDVISMIKSLSFLIQEKEHNLAPVLRLYMQAYLQNFMYCDLAPLIQASDVKERPIFTFLRQAQALIGDSDRLSSKRKGGSRKPTHSGGGGGGGGSSDKKTSWKYKRRLVGAGSAQLHLLRVMLRSMDDGQGRGLYRKEIDEKTLSLLSEFHEVTEFFPHFTALLSTVQLCSRNLGELWYRELYIQITNCTQFPIEMSLPFLLSEKVVHSTRRGKVPVLENVVCTLDLYNDAAAFALNVLQLRHIYDEIEAEVNLVFDQMMFLTGEQMYEHFKNAASSTFLDGSYKDAIEAIKGSHQLTVQEKRFAPPAAQRHVLLLGRSIDLNYLISSHINQKISKDIETVIKYFESGDLSVLLDVEMMLEIVKFTHHRLSLVLELDAFDELFKSANADVNAKHVCGKLIYHLKSTLFEDVSPNYTFNVYSKRFVRSTVISRRTGRERDPKPTPGPFGFGSVCAKAWNVLHRPMRGFVGRPHIDALVRIAGESGVCFLVNSSLELIEERLNDLMPYLNSLMEGLPPINLPSVARRGSAECFLDLEKKVKHYFSYATYLNESYQCFREIGNLVAFLSVMESSLAVRQAAVYVNIAPFLGFQEGGETEEDAMAIAGQPSAAAKRDPKRQHQSSPFRACLEEFAASSSGQSFLHSRVRSPKVLQSVGEMLSGIEGSCDGMGCSQVDVNVKSGMAMMGKIEQAVKRILSREDCAFASSMAASGYRGALPESGRDDRYCFYIAFSLLNYLFCMDCKNMAAGGGNLGAGLDATIVAEHKTSLTLDDLRVKDSQIHGHGFAICGMVIMTALRETRKFQMFDFSYNIIDFFDELVNVGGVEREGEGEGEGEDERGGEDKGAGSVEAKKMDGMRKKFSGVYNNGFINEARTQKEVHYNFLRTMQCNMKKFASDEGVREYSPPTDDRNIFN